ncbi:MAG: TIR domain-containing protein [Anaerolineae bacterium]|nr:TIR domain-containing protein [Anaerolineae bacterium]
MDRVFVSYSRRDKAFTERIARDLSDAGLDVWVDFRQIQGGERWQEEIYRGIERCEILIACLSPDSVKSVWCGKEILAARDLGKVILPIMVRESLSDLRVSESLAWLTDIHFINFIDRYEQAFPELLEALPGKRRIGTYDLSDVEQIPNPFKGLEAFQQTDAAFFFGRETMIQRALNGLRSQRGARFLGVVGASGSGKSSLVRAGVIPQLRTGKLPGSEQWVITIFTPGADPIQALADRIAPLLGEGGPSSAAIASELLQFERPLSQFSEQILTQLPAEARWLLLIDQFEEVFTRTGEIQRGAFLQHLSDTAKLAQGRTEIIITMRADFFDRIGAYPHLAELFEQDNLLIVTEMTSSDLLRAITGPAQAVGLIYEDGLSERILEDVRRQPGSLPLLQYALTALYQKRDGRTLTHAAYDAIGGVKGALAQQAEMVYNALNPTQQDLMRRLLFRLIEVNEKGEGTRRRVVRDELQLQGIIPSAIQELIDLMTDARLLVTSREIKPNADQAQNTLIEISHEALIREWERFRNWIASDLEDLRYGSELLQAANDWQAANGDAAYLLTGSRLLRAEAWLQTADANTLQREFIGLSIEEREKREVSERQQAERELTLQRISTERLRILTVVLLAGLVIAIALTGVALTANSRAEENAARERQAAILAEQSAAEARSFALSASAERALSDGENDLALSLAVEAARVIASPPPQTRLTLSTIAYALGTRRVFTGQNTTINNVQLLNDGLSAISGGADGSIVRWTLADGQIVQRYAGHPRRVSALTVSPNGLMMLSGSNDGNLILWDVTTGNEIRRFSQQGTINAIVFNPTGSRAITASGDGTIYLWNVNTGTLIREFIGHEDNVTSLALSPINSDVLISAGWDNTIRLWNVRDGQLRAMIRTESAVLSLAIAPDGRSFVIGLRHLISDTVTFSPLRLYTLESLIIEGKTTFEEAPILPGFALDANTHTDDVSVVAYNPNGTQFASGGADGLLILWDAVSLQPLNIFSDHGNNLRSGAIRALQFAPHGRQMLSGSSDQTLRLWDVERAEVIRDFIGHTERGVVAVFGTGDRTVLSGGYDGTLRLWDVQTGRTIREYVGHEQRVFTVDMSDDGRFAISGGEDETLRVWDVISGDQLAELNPEAGIITMARFLPNSTEFVFGSEAGVLALWDAATGSPIRPFLTPSGIGTIEAIAISSDGTRLLSGGSDQRVSLWDITTGQLIRQFSGHASTVTAVAFSQDATRFASGAQNGRLILWTDDGTRLTDLEGHDRVVIGVQFSPDGNSLLSAAFDYTIRLWDIESAFEVRRYELDPRSLINLQSLEFSANGQVILTGLTDSTIRLWRLIATVDELLVWSFRNRYIAPLSCTQRDQFRLDPCDAAGNAPEAAPFQFPEETPLPPSLLELEAGMDVIVNVTHGERLRLRSAPGLNAFEIVRAVNVPARQENNTRLLLLEGPVMVDGLRWWRVDSPDGIGWVAEYLTVEATDPAENLQLLVPIIALESLAD